MPPRAFAVVADQLEIPPAQRPRQHAMQIERRLLYTEGLTTPDTAAPLVGTLEIERAIGQAFFADRYRMDRDWLADGAQAPRPDIPALYFKPSVSCQLS